MCHALALHEEEKRMGESPLICVSICVVVLLVLGSLSNVVGSQPGITDIRICEKGSRYNYDTTPPVTTAILDPPVPNGENGWYIHDVRVTLMATDDDSGVNVTYYQINYEGWEVYSYSFIVVDGKNTVQFYSVDNTGNTEEVKQVDINIDSMPPMIMTTFDPPYPVGKNGWYISNVIVTLNANDVSGVKVLWWRYSGSQEWQNYISPFNLTENFPSFEMDCEDNAGNSEYTKPSSPLPFDQTPPALSANFTWKKTGMNQYVITITVIANDAMSGMQRVEFYWNGALVSTVGGPGPMYVYNYSWTPGVPFYILKAIAYDMAGLNSSAELLNPHNIQNQGRFIYSLLLHHQIMNLFFGLREAYQ
jgi:hypothetical protein